MKILIWGTGRIASKIVGKKLDENNIMGFIDNNVLLNEYSQKPVYRPIDVLNLDYDAIVVCTLASKSIYKQCKDIGLNLEKIIFTYENYKIRDINQNYDLINKVLGEYGSVIKNRYHLVRDTETICNALVENKNNKTNVWKEKIKEYYDRDYVRLRTMEFVVKEIKKRNIIGNIAEAGVFRGEFAQYLNLAFPEKKLYLFDTFEGFDEEEAVREKNAGHVSEAFIVAHKDTSEDIVINRMPNKDSVVIKKGYFPESSVGLEDIFSFVSLDMDFEESIYQGLLYFYPRLSKGGYIFIHDYNSTLRGVERAVDRYEQQEGDILPKVPLCDADGTLVLTK